MELPPNSERAPFRREVPVEDFEKIESRRKQIEVVEELVQNPEERPLGAALIQELIVDPQVPNEVKLEAIQHGLKLISGYGNEVLNKTTAGALIDSIRGCTSPDIRIRMAAILSHDLQDVHIQKQAQESPAALVDAIKRREAFELVSQDPEDPALRAWATYLLKPRGALQIFNTLYDKDPNVVFLPHIREEETSIEESGLPVEEIERVDVGAYDWVRLDPNRFYSPENRLKIKSLLGKEPPLFITRKIGAAYFHVEFPQDLSEKVARDIESFRQSGIPTRDQIRERWRTEFFPNFLARMNAEQRAEFDRDLKDKNIAIDFRVATIRPSQSEDEPTAGRVKMAA